MTQKKVYREDETAIVAGVVAGLAKYFSQDPVLFRVMAIFLLLISGVFPGLLLYVIAWLFIPKRTRHHADYTVD